MNYPEAELSGYLRCIGNYCTGEGSYPFVFSFMLNLNFRTRQARTAGSLGYEPNRHPISMKSLETNPKRNALVRDSRLAAKGFRVLVVKKHIVFYKIDEKEKVVDVAKILYGRRDWTGLLF